MKLALVGIGQAGGKIVDAFVDYEERIGTDIFRSPIAVNTAKADLVGLNHVPIENRVLIGQSRVKGHGVGADNELGAEIAADDVDEVQAAIDDVPTHEVDAFLLVAGLGGGTGSGGAPVIAQHLTRLYTEPVFGLGVLPAADEGGIYTLNAARSFQTFVRETDNLLVFDNDAWRQTGESLRGGFEEINREIVRRFGVLLDAGEVGESGAVGEAVVDSSEIINTLSGGGVSTLGYASVTVDRRRSGGLLSRFTGNDRGFGEDDLDAVHAVNRITSLVRKATLGRLTLPCEVDGAERALLVLSGPRRYLSRKGIERGRKWLEEETGSMEVRGGDDPRPSSDVVECVVLLSGVHQIPRVKQFQRVAIEAQDSIGRRNAAHDDNLDQLVNEGADELSPLY